MSRQPGPTPAFGAPDFEPVTRFDDAIDKYFDDHLRGRPELDRLMYGASAAADHSRDMAGLGCPSGVAFRLRMASSTSSRGAAGWRVSARKRAGEVGFSS